MKKLAVRADENLTDTALLTRALSSPTLLPAVRSAFEDMLETLQGGGRRVLTAKQRAWVEREVEAHVPQYVNAYSSGAIARGKEVVIQCGPLVKRPPGRV